MTDDLFDDDESEMVIRVNIPPTLANSADIAQIKAQQDALGEAMDQLLSIYRNFDKTRRPLLKERLKTLHERLVDLGVTLGISRVSLDHIWKG